MQQLTAMQPPQHVENAGDFTSRRSLRPSTLTTPQERTQVAVPRVLEREAVDHRAVVDCQRKRIEHADRTLVTIEELAEVGFAEPAVDPAAGLDAYHVGN